MKPRWLLLIPLLFITAGAIDGVAFGSDIQKIDEISEAAVASEPAVRLSMTTTTTIQTRGNCGYWEREFERRGATEGETDFFFGRITGTNIILRETGCGLDSLNERTGDSGICQINPIHNRAGYFAGVYYPDGGWLQSRHGLHTRDLVDDPEWVSACLDLYRVCGPGPWTPGNYSCLNRRLM